MGTKHQIILLAERYAEATGLALATVSARVLGRGSKLAALIAGGDIGCDRFDRAVAWFAANWPAGTPWPEGIARPEPDEADVTAGSAAPSRCGASQSAREARS